MLFLIFQVIFLFYYYLLLESHPIISFIKVSNCTVFLNLQIYENFIQKL